MELILEPLALIAWLDSLPLWLGLVILGVSACIEYVFPPFPGDTITLAGAIMVGAAGWPWWAVMAAIACGSVVGISVDWRAGQWLEHAQRRTWLHRVLARPAYAQSIERVKARFARHGSWFILLNRFLPAFRSVFFLVSGMVGISFGRVLGLGVASVLLWTMALLGVGAAVGFHIEELLGVMSRYSAIMWGVVIVVMVVWCGKALAKKRIAKRSES